MMHIQYLVANVFVYLYKYIYVHVFVLTDEDQERGSVDQDLWSTVSETLLDYM